MNDNVSTGLPMSRMNGDYADRYSVAPDLMQEIRAQERIQRRLDDRSARKEAELAEDLEIYSQDPASVASFVRNFADHESKLNSMVSRGRYAEAKSYYDDIMSVIDDNADEIIGFTKLGSVGPLGAAIASNAQRIVTGAFEQTPIAMADGSQTTLGSVLRDSGSVVQDVASDEFIKFGFVPSVADMYFNGTDPQKQAIRSIVDPFVARARQGGASVIPNHIQLTELAEDVVNNWDALEGVFGDGTSMFIQHMQAIHEGTGGAAETMKTLVDVAATMGASKGLSGKSLTHAVMSGYNSLAESVFASPDEGGRTAPVSPSQRMTFDAVLTAGIKAAGARGVPVELDNPQMRQAVREVMDCMAYAGAAGVDLFSESHSAGRSMSNAFGDYVANAMTGTEQPSDNVINSLMGVRSVLDNLVTGGRDFAQTVSKITGNPGDYLSSLSRANAGWSSSMEADGVALGIKQYMLRKMIPNIAAGMTPDAALQDLVNGKPGAYPVFVSELSDIIGRSMIGDGASSAAGAVAARVVDNLLSGKPVSVEDTVFDLAFPSDGLPDPVNIPDEIKTLRNWYNGNVVKQAAYGDRIKECQDHLRGQGLNDLQTSEIMAKVNERAANMERLGGNPGKVYESLLQTGHYLKPVYATDATGGTAVDERTGKPVLAGVEESIGNLNRVGYMLDGVVFPEGHYTADRAGYEYGQNELRRYQAMQYQAEAAAMKKSAVQDVEDD